MKWLMYKKIVIVTIIIIIPIHTSTKQTTKIKIGNIYHLIGLGFVPLQSIEEQ